MQKKETQTCIAQQRQNKFQKIHEEAAQVKMQK